MQARPASGEHAALPSGWECALDAATGHWYYFNRALGQTSWVHPSMILQQHAQTHHNYATAISLAAASAVSAAATVSAPVSTGGAAPTTSPNASTHAAASQPPTATAGLDVAPASAGTRQLEAAAGGMAGDGHRSEASRSQSGASKNGWYYRDRSGSLHGPFHRDHLSAWRAFLPMDLFVWYVQLGPQPHEHQRQQEEKPEKQQQAGDQPDGEQSGGEQGRDAQQQQQQDAAAAAKGSVEASGDYQGSAHRASPGRASPGRASPAGEGWDEEAGDEGTERPAKRARTQSVNDGAQTEADAVGQPWDDVAPHQPATQGNGREEHDSDEAVAEPPRRSGSLSRLASPSSAPVSSNGADTGQDVVPAGQSTAGAGPSSAEEAIACGLPGIELAELLGDGHLLSDWRQRNPGHRALGTAPPAPAHDNWLRAAAAAAAHAHAHAHAHAVYSAYHGHRHYAHGTPAAYGCAGGSADGPSRPRSRDESMLEYAEAVLAGLPPDDEAVVLARQAAAAGKTLADVVNFSWGASSGSFAPAAATLDNTETVRPPVDEHGVPTEYVRDPRSGRLTAVGGGGGASDAKALYGEYGGWVDPEQIEDYLAKAKRWRQEQLPQLWARTKLKEIREAKVKKAARTAAIGGV